MDKWFVIFFGVLVAVLYVPPIVVPARHRELARSLSTTRFLRRFSVVPLTLGIIAILLSSNADVPHRMLFALGVMEVLLCIYLLTCTDFIIRQLQFLYSKPLSVWVARGVLKFSLGVLIAVWGVFCF